MKNDFFSQGQTIIEVLVALTTAIVIVSAITMAVITALRNVEYTKAQNTATRYAQEGMEFMRFMRDSNYTLFFIELKGGVSYCLDKGATVLYEPCSTTTSNVDLFLRTITLEENSPYCAAISQPPPTPTPVNTSIKVTVSVSWTDSKCASSARCHESKLVSCLSDYRVVPTP